jgi:hypothetical protein
LIANQGGGKLEIVIFLFPIDTQKSVVLAGGKVLKNKLKSVSRAVIILIP